LSARRGNALNILGLLIGIKDEHANTSALPHDVP
jgi:hypothetical protein